MRARGENKSLWLWMAALPALLPLTRLDATGWQLVGNSLWLTVCVLALCLPSGTILAWLLFRTDLPLRRCWLALLVVQLFVPLYLHAAAWDAGFGLAGWFTRLLGQPHLVLLERWRGAVWVHAVAALPWVVVIVGTGMRLAERPLEEQALLCGPPRRVLMRVTLPQTASALVAAALGTALWTWAEMTATNVFRVRTYTEEVYQALANYAQPPQAWELAWPLLGVVLWCGLWLHGLALRQSPQVRQRLEEPPLVMPLLRCRLPLALGVALVMGLVALVPLGSLIYRAGLVLSRGENGLVRDWSALTAAAIVWRSVHESRTELFTSLRLAAWTSLWTIMAGVLLAWWAQGGRWRARFVLGASAMLWAVPGPIVALAVIWLLNRRDFGLAYWYDQTLLAPVLGLLLRTLPLATWIVWAGFRAVPTATLEAAATDGAGPWTALARVALPLAWRPVLCAACVVFIVAFGDLTTTVLLLPPGSDTAGRKLFGLIHSSTDDQSAGLALAVLLVLSPLTWAASVLGTRRAA